jgi:hypothetical protein
MSDGAFDVAKHAEEAWRLFSGMLQAGDAARTGISARSSRATNK